MKSELVDVVLRVFSVEIGEIEFTELNPARSDLKSGHAVFQFRLVFNCHSYVVHYRVGELRYHRVQRPCNRYILS